MASKKNGRSGQRGRGNKMKSSPKYYSWQLSRTIAETRALEMKSLIHESDEVLRMLIQEKEARPEDPPPNH